MQQPVADREFPKGTPDGQAQPSDAPHTTLSQPPDVTPVEWTQPQFGALYIEHSKAIYYLALRFLGDPEKAADATHDVFLKAFKKIDQFRGEASWRTWLYRIAINHCRNLQQTWNERHVFSNADEVIWDNAEAKTDSPLRILETKELNERIQKTLDAIPAEYRLLLLLVADEELSYEEIAELTEQSAGAVRGKLHRARKAFGAIFEKSA